MPFGNAAQHYLCIARTLMPVAQLLVLLMLHHAHDRTSVLPEQAVRQPCVYGLSVDLQDGPTLSVGTMQRVAT